MSPRAYVYGLEFDEAGAHVWVMTEGGSLEALDYKAARHLTLDGMVRESRDILGHLIKADVADTVTSKVMPLALVRDTIARLHDGEPARPDVPWPCDANGEPWLPGDVVTDDFVVTSVVLEPEGDQGVHWHLEDDDAMIYAFGQFEHVRQGTDAVGEGAADGGLHAYEDGPNLCPYCGSWDIEGGHVEIDGDEAIQPVRCNVCGRHWRDVYHIAGYVGCD